MQIFNGFASKVKNIRSIARFLKPEIKVELFENSIRLIMAVFDREPSFHEMFEIFRVQTFISEMFNVSS